MALYGNEIYVVGGTGQALHVIHGCIGKIHPGLTADFYHLWRGGKKVFATFNFKHMGWQRQTPGQQI
jgi:hypothetical protein